MSQVAYDTETLHTLVYHMTSGFLLQSLQLAGIGVMLFYLNAEAGRDHLAADAVDPRRKLVLHPLSPAAASALLGSGGQAGFGLDGNARGDPGRQGLRAGGP